MITLIGKAKLRKIEVNDYLSQVENIRTLTDNLIGLNKTATIEVWGDKLILHCELCETSLYVLSRNYNVKKESKNKYIVL